MQPSCREQDAEGVDGVRNEEDAHIVAYSGICGVF